MKSPVNIMTVGIAVLALGCGSGTLRTPATDKPTSTVPLAAPTVSTNAPILNLPPQPTDDGIIAQPRRTDWLSIKGNQFYRQGQPWTGRGVTLHDTRSCDFCTSHAPNVSEVKRRIDEAVSVWHVNFFRLLLQSFASASYAPPSSGERAQWQTLLVDPAYMHDVQEIVEYIGTKPGVYVMVSLWKDPSFTTQVSDTSESGWPTQATAKEWVRLAEAFKEDAHVLYAVANEPEHDNPATDAGCQASMSGVVQAIRDVEDSAGSPHHVIAVQGTRQWGRILDYYVSHPIMNDGGDNIAYESHPYTAQGNFEASLAIPNKTLPIIIGEFAPAAPYMSAADASALMVFADRLHIPWTAWDFHTACSAGKGNNMLLQDTGGCVYGIPLTPTAWGTLVKSYITAKQ